MKNNKVIILFIALFILATALYRIWDARPLGFAPQLAVALFAGAIFRPRRFAFIIPIISLLISDVIYQFLFTEGLSLVPGFYNGQLVNYLLFILITVIGFFVEAKKPLKVFMSSILVVAVYFIISNFFVWLFGLSLDNVPYPKTFDGMMECYVAGLPFLRGNLMGTLFFGAIFFGVYYLIAVRRKQHLLIVQ